MIRPAFMPSPVLDEFISEYCKRHKFIANSTFAHINTVHPESYEVTLTDPSLSPDDFFSDSLGAAASVPVVG